MGASPGDANEGEHPDTGSRAQPRLLIAIATTMRRAPLIVPANLPTGPDWRYLVFCQPSGDEDGSAPGRKALDALASGRHDVSAEYIDGRGAARSRNAALSRADGELLLFCDDDITLDPEGLAKLLQAFDRHAGIALIADSHAATGTSGSAMTLFNTARIRTFDLAVRPAEVRSAGIAFDERFGAGQENYLGDEYIFVTDCLRAGLKGRYEALAMATHEGDTSGMAWGSPRDAAARARVFERVFGRLGAIPVKLGFAWRHRGRFETWNAFCRFLTDFLPPRPGA